MRGEMRILVRLDGGVRHIAVLEAGKLVEYEQEEDGSASWVGRVLVGRVERVLPAVGAAFVDIGQPKNGFLPLKEMESFQQSAGTKPLVTGQDILVQVKKDAKGDKGAFLTRDIALAGQYGILMPLNRHIGVSSRLTSPEEREAAKRLGIEISGGEYGMVVRHAALGADAAEISAEMQALRMQWEGIIRKAPYAKAPATLYSEASCLQGMLRDYARRCHITILYPEGQAAESGIEGIGDSGGIHNGAEAGMDADAGTGSAANDSVSSSAIVYQPTAEAQLDAEWQSARIEQQLQDALARQVQLPGGGTLVIDEREALTTIDVNSAHFTGEKGIGSLALAQNLAACPEIARYIRLRGPSGILLIDFMDMSSDEEREEVQHALENALADDRAKTVLHGFTRLGLMEMTRKRTRQSLHEMLTEPCTACKGTGRRVK